MLRGMATRAHGPAPAPTPAQAQARVTLIVGEEEFLVDRTIRELVAAARAVMAVGDDAGDLHDV